MAGKQIKSASDARLRVIEGLLLDIHASIHDNLESMLEAILDGVESLHGINRGLIYAVNDDQSRLDVYGWKVKGKSRNEFFHSLKDEESFARQVYEHHSARFEPNAKSKRVSKKGRTTFNIHGSLVGLPLIFAGERVGVMVCWSDRPPHPVLEDKDRLSPLATLAALNIGLWKLEKTRRHQQEVATQQLDAFKKLVEHLHVCIFRKNAQSVFTECNDEFVRHLGQNSKEDVLNHSDFDFYEDEYAKAYQLDDKKVRDKGNVVEINESNRLKGTNETRKVEGFKTRIVVDPKTGEFGVLGMFWDVTRRTQLAEQKTSRLNLIQKILRIALKDLRDESEDEILRHLDEISPRMATPSEKNATQPRSQECAAALSAVNAIYKGIGLSRQEIAEEMKFGKNSEQNALGKCLRSLEQDGFLQHTGRQAGAKWEPTDKGKAWKPLA